jgi:DNA-binding NarL/FixJ family response regulator
MSATATVIAPARIVVADDHRLFREALGRLLAAEPDLEVIGEAADGLEAIALTRELHPDILLLDVAMPHADGMEVLRRIGGSLATTRILLLTASIDRPTIAAALRLGAHGLVLKESGAALLLKAVRGVRSGEYWIARDIVGDLMEMVRGGSGSETDTVPKQNFGLTPRELQIVAAVVAAYGNREISEKFNITGTTVKHHLTNIFDKLGVSNRLELALFALHHGLVSRNDL